VDAPEVELRVLAQLSGPCEAQPGGPLLHALLVAAGSVPPGDVVITDADEVGEVGAEHVVDLLDPGLRIVIVIEVPLMHDGVGALVLDELEHGARTVERAP
jgi:hypothetical protein